MWLFNLRYFSSLFCTPYIVSAKQEYAEELPQGNLLSNSRCDAANYRSLIHSERSS